MTVIIDPLRDDPQTVVDYLTYANYRYNRLLSPTIQPAGWGRVYGDGWRRMERLYRTEKEAQEVRTIRVTCPCGAERMQNVMQCDVADVLALGSLCGGCYARQEEGRDG